MRTKIGNRLKHLRDERKMNQDDFANLLGVSTSAYARMERNETSPDLSQILRWSEILNVPVQEFLPENITFQANNENGNVGIVLGNVNYYTEKTEVMKELETENQRLRQEIRFLEEKNTLLQNQVDDYRRIMSLDKSTEK